MKKIIIISILAFLLVSSVCALVVEDMHSSTLPTSASGTSNKEGMIIIPNFDVMFISMEKHPASGCVDAYLYDADANLLQQKLFSGVNATGFNYNLTAGLQYFVLCDNGGANYNRQYQNLVGLPEGDVNINWHRGTSNWINYTDYYFEILAVVTESAANASPEIIVNHISPANETHNNTILDVLYNVSMVANCSLSVNDTYYLTSDNVAANTTLNFTMGLSLDGEYFYYVSCNRSDGLNGSTGVFIYIYDNSQPFITVNYPASDNSTRFTTNRTLTFNASTQDSYLFQTNLTIKNSTGGVLYTEYVADNSPNTTRTWNQSIDMSMWSVGKYYVTFEVSDAHTDNKIKDFKPVKDEKENQINYKSPDEWGGIKFDIKLKDSETELKEFYDVKKSDRHSAVYQFDKKGDERLKYTFTVTADYPCKQMWYSDYNAHITCSNGMGGIWFDANFADKEALYNVIKVNEYEYDIEIWTSSHEIAFDSLGGLNYNSVNVSFIIQTNMTVKINDTASGTFLSKFTATIGNQSLYANNTNNVTFWLDPENNYTVSGSASGFFVIADTFYLNKTTVVVVLNATSAGVFLQFYDEITQVKLSGTTVYVEIISTTGNTSQIHNTNTGEQLISGLVFGEYEIRYYATNYYTRTYYATLNTSTTQNIDLFLLNDTVGVRVIHTLLDQDSNPAINIRIKLLRNYVSGTTSEFKTVQMAQTNFEGQAVLYVELYDVWYKMIYIDVTGNIIKETDPTPFLSIDTQDILNLRTDLYEGWREYGNTFYNLDNVTVGNLSYFRFTYTDTQNLVREGCLRVDLINSDGLENICYNCTLSTAATLTCRYDKSRIGNYKAVAMIDTNTPNSYHILNTIWVIITENAPQLLQEGIFFSLIIIGSLALMGIATITGSVIIMFMGILAVSVVGFISGFHIGWLYFLAVFVFMMIYMVRRGKE